MRYRAGFLSALLLAGCSVLPPPVPAPARYDFGALPAAAPALPVIRGAVTLTRVTAPDWMAGTDLYYRLGYANAARPRPYADSRWLAAPDALVAQQLRMRLAQAASGGVDTGGIRLRVALLTFDQYFASPRQSVGRVAARVTCSAADGRIWQKTFALAVPAATPDARGGAAALAQASDRLATAVIAWLAALPH